MPVSVAPLLQRFVDDELALAPTLIEQVRAKAVQQLQAVGIAHSVAAPDVYPRREAARALQTHAGRFCERYVDALRDLVRADLEAPERPTPSATQAAADGLTLMDEALVESDIEISRAVMLIDSTVESEQRELQALTSALRGEAHVSLDSNPLRPALVAHALWQATDELALAPAPRVQALRASAGAIGSALRLAFAAACRRIAAQGIEPSLYRTRLLASGSVAGDDVSAQRGASFDVTRPGALHGLLAAMPVDRTGGAVTPRAATIAQPEPSLMRLDALMRRAASTMAAGTPVGNTHSPALEVHAMPSSAPSLDSLPSQPAAAQTVIDQRLIELLSRLFDAIFVDPTLPAPAKGAIARLQASALRVALRDTTLLDTHEHPTWRLMDRIASACQQAAYAGPERQAALARACDGLADEVARHTAPDASLYRQALARLDALEADDLRQAQQAAQPAIAALRHTECRMRVQAQVRSRLEEQFLRSPVGAATRRFMLGAWAQVLAESIVRSGADSEATAALTRCVDDLLWSLHPPAHPASRQRLVNLLPGLLARLRSTMAQCGLEPCEQRAVLDEWEAAHTATLWPGGPAAKAMAGAVAATETAEDIVRRLRDEVFNEAPPRHDFGDSVLDLSTLETVPAELLPDVPAPNPLDDRAHKARHAEPAVAALPLGRAVRLLLQGRWIGAQLIWRSEGGDLLLFADESGRTQALTRRALERLKAEGLASFALPGSMVQRAVDALLARLALA